MPEALRDTVNRPLGLQRLEEEESFREEAGEITGQESDPRWLRVCV